jgi:hypothetical protein
MAFFRRREDGHAGPSTATRLTIVRDLVEIFAIVAAGVWAFYTFVYENQIKPAQSKPILQATSSLERLGERHGLVAIDARLSIKNVGTTDVWLYGLAETVSGSSIRPVRTDLTRADVIDRKGRLLEPEWTGSMETPVYELAILTKIADRTAEDSFELRPGDTESIDRIVYVRAGRFDELDTRLSLRYASRDTFVPCRIVVRGSRISVEPTDDSDTDGINETTASLSLWR